MKPWFHQGLHFSCTRCGQCCTGAPGYVWFTGEEAKAMAHAVYLPVPEFLAKYARQVDGQWTLNETKSPKGNDCVFLRWDEQGRSLCLLYDARPKQCRTWPFWPENLPNQDAWLRTAQRCPGMANGLKGEGKLYSLPQILAVKQHQESPS